jgi:hypothetical protein
MLFWLSWSHTSQDCTRASPTHSNDNQPPHRLRGGKQTVVCYKCNTPGHYTNHCPEDKLWVKRKPKTYPK